MQILDLLWASGVPSTERSVRLGKDYTKAIEKASLGEEKMKENLGSEQLALFDQFMKDYDQMRDFNECESFITGFRLGAKIMMDVLNGGINQEL